MKLLQITLIITYVILKAETNSIDENQILAPNTKISSSESRKKLIVCYYPSWAIYSISAANQRIDCTKYSSMWEDVCNEKVLISHSMHPLLQTGGVGPFSNRGF